MTLADSADPLRRGIAIAAGTALIAAPLLALVVKFFSIGWLTFFIMYASPLLVIGYVLQLVIAIGALLRARGALRTAPGRARGVAAAWATSIGVVLAAFFMVDTGDMNWGSTFMYWIGQASNDALGSLSTILAWLASAAWVLGWGWLVVEWIVALVQRRRVRQAPAAA